MAYEHVIYDVKDGIATITLNRPKAMNALCSPLNVDLLAALNEAEKDESVRVVILTGGEKVFAAGADIKEMQNATPLEAEKVAALAHSINNKMESFPVPIIAAINGMALGGGMELTLACDFRIAGEGALFGLPEVGLGILPGAGGTQRLVKLIGLGRAKEVVMLGKKIKAPQALEYGLVSAVVADDKVLEEAVAMAGKLMRNPASALFYAKSALTFGDQYGPCAGKVFEKAVFAATFATADQKEGMTAMLEKRKPEYKNER